MKDDSGIFVLLRDIVRLFRYMLTIVYIFCLIIIVYFLGYKILLRCIIFGKGITVHDKWYLDNGILAVIIGIPVLILSVFIERFYFYFVKLKGVNKLLIILLLYIKFVRQKYIYLQHKQSKYAQGFKS